MSGRRIAVKRSGIHGKGVFALAALSKGERIFEYEGERISWKEALRRHPHDPSQPHHTFYFALDDGRVIDGLVGGNSARWINHSCAPNCEAEEIDGRVFIHAGRDIAAGEELYYDYGLVLEGKHTKKVKRDYLCLCGAPNCRGTMLAPKDGSKSAKKADKDGKKAKLSKRDKSGKLADKSTGKSVKAEKSDKSGKKKKGEKA
ncbi:SET domain-containing protein [Robbsia andropogonis]|uniref:SET domain-containing protein n=1 Tax=Robbsia andropogonis TaxID=28092 RepID=UPI0009E575AE|nr:SET domain-containing protein-lysine N-methyltransferase [Robbsia andropogonis]